ncbi:unnamed protein product [Durusdinium trenchii]|uniref:Uncharacterized protein n=1 Tax=Durusdinium trenchii TaxID=1381693 RepID=A0ABP0ID86_9DINO
MGATNGKGSGKGRPGGWEPLGARVGKLEAKMAALEAKRAKEEAEQEKADMLAAAAARAKAEASMLLAKAGDDQSLSHMPTCRTRSRSNPRSKMMADISSDDECSSSKGKVVAASDLNGLFQSVGMTRRVPKGVWTTDKLTEAIVNHAEFERKQWVTQSKQLVEGPAPRDNVQLVKAVLKAYGA